MMKSILVIDDNVTNLKIVEKALKGIYKPILLTSGAQALKYLQCHVPDLILLDLVMPDMDGFETIKKIKQIKNNANVPIIFLTATTDSEVEVQGLEYGAVDFITKPFVEKSMLSRIRMHLELASYQNNLKEIILKKTQLVEKIQDALVNSLSDLVECRDGNTGGHVRRTATYTGILLDALLERKMFEEQIDENYVLNMKRAAVLHDIGKVGIADSTLLKDTCLSDGEMEYMRRHTTYGGKALKKAISTIAEKSFLDDAMELAYYHHEKWNGSGYPKGLKGEVIPLGARILSIADVYDALTSKRTYKEAFSHEKACEMIEKGRGIDFDSRIVTVFLEVKDLFHEELMRFNALEKGE